MTFRKKTGKATLYAAAFFLPVVLCALVFVLHGIAPFGDATIMTGDAEYQFVDYFSYLKTIVFGNNDLFYSFSKNLGGSLTGFSAYYFLSPINLLTLLFPSEYLPLALSVMYPFTLGLCSLSFCIFLSARFGLRRSHLIFSLSYAFMGFLSVYFQLTMYYSSLIIFPLLVLGVMTLSETGEYSLYLICLFLSVVFNYYAAFMHCIFSLLMFIYSMALRPAGEGGDRETVSRIMRFGFSSILAVLLASFTLIPALMSLGDEKNSFSLGFFRMFPLHRLFGALYTGTFKGDVAGGLPNIFCGTLVLLLLVFFFFNSAFVLRERLLSGAFLAFLILNLWLNPLNVAWHGFNQPIGFPYRYSYMLSFLVIFLACRGYCQLSAGKKPLIIAAAVFVLYSLFLLMSGSENVGIKEVLLTGAVLTLSIAALVVFEKKKATLYLGLFFLVLNAAELTYNYYDVLNHFELASLSEYREYVSEVGQAVDTIKTEDPGFYRMDKYFRRTHNDAMQFDYAGLSHFSSSEKKEKIAFMGRLGFRNNGNWAFYSEPTTVFLDSFFGVKYLMSLQHSIPNDYEKLNREGDVRRYRNNSALPLMFISNSEIREVDSRGFYGDPFALQEAIADSMNGKENRLFIPARIKEFKVEGLEEGKEDGVALYRKIDPKDTDAGLEYRIESTDIRTEKGERANLFAFFDAPGGQNVGLYRYGDELGDYFDTYRWNIVNLEDNPKEDENGDYIVSLRPREQEMKLSGAYFYYEDRDRSSEFFKTIRDENPCDLDKLTSSHLKGSVDMPEEKGKCVVLSIPFDKAWKIYVDGERTEGKPAVDLLLSFDTPPGEHSVELFYRPQGIMAGVTLSLLALLILMWLWVKEELIRRKEARDERS